MSLDNMCNKLAPYKLKVGTSHHYAALDNMNILKKHSYTARGTSSKNKYTFHLNFYFDYGSLFREILDSLGLEINIDVLNVILCMADISHSYDTSFWISSPMIDSALKTRSDIHELYIHANWHVNITPYCYEKTSRVYPEVIYKVDLKLLKKPTRKINYYRRNLCLYMAHKHIYHVNTPQVEWSNNKFMYGGKNWVPGYSYGTIKLPLLL